MKMNLVVVGTIGLDDIKTPFGNVKGVLGGSGTYASCAGSFFAKPGLISVAGRDLPKEAMEIFRSRKIDLAGVTFSEKTFRWSGYYEFDMNEAKTLETQLNSLAGFQPLAPENYKNPKVLFLGNIDPLIQLDVIAQMKARPFILLDTMNYWIANHRAKLEEVIKKVDMVVMNEGEARQLCDTPNLIKAGREILSMGPSYAIIKKGEHGALLFSYHGFFSAPAYPLEELRDPTGAGDSFAGGLSGFLANAIEINENTIRKGIIYGSAVASFCAENFSLDYLNSVDKSLIKERYNVFREIRKF